MDRGSPAWAGIDLEVPWAATSPLRLPRVGGDRPQMKMTTLFLAAAPPRGRG